MWLLLLLALGIDSEPPAECLLRPPRRPPIPAAFRFPAPAAGDTMRSPLDTGTAYFADLVGIQFTDSASAVQVCAVFVKYEATLVGGLPTADEYVLRLPAQPMGWAPWEARLHSLNAQSGVEYAAPYSWKEAAPGFRAK